MYFRPFGFDLRGKISPNSVDKLFALITSGDMAYRSCKVFFLVDIIVADFGGKLVVEGLRSFSTAEVKDCRLA